MNMNINIDIKDYVSEEEIKDIIGDEIRRSVRYHMNTEAELSRIITNISYKELWKQIELEVPNCEKTLKEKTIERIRNISDYDIFRRKDAYGAEDSLATKLIDECVKENKDIINDKVKNIFNELSCSDLRYKIQDILEEYIEKLFEKGE